MKLFAMTYAAMAIFATSLGVSAAKAPRQMENLGRGLIAIHQGGGSVWIGWRILGIEPDDIAFNLYRRTGTRNTTRLNVTALAGQTHFVDTEADLTKPNSYYVRPVVNGRELRPDGLYTLAANPPARQYLSIPLKTPAGYTPNDASAGDLDGDGEYEIVVHQTGQGRDNAQAGITDPPILQAYQLDGAFMWEIHLGKNIREGAHYTQFMVYDLDGDGFAEIVCKTADGTVDGKGQIMGDPAADYVNREQNSKLGKVLDGPEFLTVFDGRTGAALATTGYLPPRGNIVDWGDDYGNRVDRFLAGVAYLDGERPSVVMCRGYYTRTVLTAWNWRGGALSRVWTFDSDDGTPGNDAYREQGNHQLSVGDVDNDGKDEIVYGACVVDHDGKGLYTTGRGHGDALHFSDLDPDRPGLEVFQVHERPSDSAAGDFRDAATGALIWGLPATRDAGRGMAANIDPRYKGYQCWSAPSDGLYSCKGVKITDRKPASCNFAVWWDGDLLRELLDRNIINKWNWADGTETNLLTADGCASNNGTKATPALSADLFGDWREEVIWRTADNQELRVYTTTIPTQHRCATLMHDPQYRLAIAWQNVAYNQPPHPGFYLGEGMEPPTRPAIRTATAAR
jgi:rhamnogalacturonan endolyase